MVPVLLLLALTEGEGDELADVDDWEEDVGDVDCEVEDVDDAAPGSAKMVPNAGT